MNRIRRSLVLATIALALLTGLPGVARADGDQKITRFDAQIRTDAAGLSTVTVNLDFDFGDEPSHGIFFYLVQRQRDADPDRWREYQVTLGAVTSATGAPVDLEIDAEGGALVVRVGDEDQTVSGVQSYTYTYTVRGLIASNPAGSGMDELSYSVIGTGWEVPIHNVTVQATGPADIQRSACFMGVEPDVGCEAGSAQQTANYAVDRLAPGEGMQIVAGFPVGTFVGFEPEYSQRYHLGNMFPVTPVSGGIAAGLTALGVGWVLARTRRSRRDQVYLGLAPGMRPAPGEQAKIGTATASAPVTVAFTPPRGARPSEVGVLLDATADDVDITATILDLAVRDHIQIVEQDGDTWRFIDRGSGDLLTDPESHLMRTMFHRGSEVTTDELAREEYADLMPGTRTALYQRVTKQLHWFTAQPSHVRGLAIAAGFGLMLLGLVVGLVLALSAGLGFIGLAFILVGITVVTMSGKFGRRTAEGSAVLAEAKGFELYLSTAEADQIKFEEGIDVFSRYLPYATVFGVADRWAKIFADLARQGRYEATDWYVGSSGPYFGASFSTSMTSLAQSLSASMQSSISAQMQANAATSGRSGFSGGGGFGGGGGGSW
ncbi:MAG: DUF2207 domain-containing protein [Propioniciclava sp.]